MFKASVVVALAALAVAPARAESDYFQLEIEMVWCYQNPFHKAEPYVTASLDAGFSRSRTDYVRDIQIAAARRDPALAREIFMMCHRYNGAALEHARAATDAQWLSTVMHTAACYSPDHGINSPRIRRAGQVFKSPYGPIPCVDAE